MPVEIYWEALGTTFGCCCGYTGDHCVPLGGIVGHWECALGWGVSWGSSREILGPTGDIMGP